MKVRRFFAPDMSQAMRMVREEVGSEAMILSNTRVAGGVELVVALEADVLVARSRHSDPRPSVAPQAAVPVGRQRDQSLDQSLARARSELSQRRAASEEGVASLKAVNNRQLNNIDDRAWDDVLASLQADPAGPASPADPDGLQPAVRQARAAPSPGPDPDEMLAMRAEIEGLKQLLRQQLGGRSAGAAAVDPVLARLRSRLERMGISASLSERLMGALEPGVSLEQAWKISLARLVEALPIAGEDVVDRGGILAFVGATGVGKTTTIGKLAAQYVLKHGSSGVALITTDSYRIAAHEQLRTFGRILDITVRVVDENNSLDEALRSLRDRRVVLIDTAGIGGSEQQSEEQSQMFAQSGCRIKKYLVLPCTAQEQVLQAACDYFKPLGLNGVVLSKIDESLSLGEVISTLVEQRLPVAYLADGQKIPDNIEVAKAKSLVSRAVVLASGRAARRETVVLRPQRHGAL
ncbi:MAG: flagellar biosynthesis protein FlhF [Motiliproteus sp.]|jgi:flagellar biosynthesis protein FlhF